MAADLGENLSAHQNIEFLKRSTEEELKQALAQIQLPFKLITIYQSQGTVVAWIVPTRKLRKAKTPPADSGEA